MRRSIRLAVCDDEAPVLSYLTDQIRKEFGKYDLCAEADIYTSPVELGKVMQEKPYDAYFLDIDMPKMNGLELARILREQKEEVPLIFVSAKEEYVFQSFEVHPFSFIRKSRFKQDMEKAVCDLSKRFCQENEAFCRIMDEASTSMFSYREARIFMSGTRCPILRKCWNRSSLYGYTNRFW